MGNETDNRVERMSQADAARQMEMLHAAKERQLECVKARNAEPDYSDKQWQPVGADKVACAPSAGAIGGAGLVMGRAIPAGGGVISAGPMTFHNPQAVPAPWVTPSGGMNLPAGEAFTRQTCIALAHQWAGHCMQQDRLHRPADGWIQRRAAVELFDSLLWDVLHAQNVPKDAAAEIRKTLARLLDAWGDGQAVGTAYSRGD